MLLQAMVHLSGLQDKAAAAHGQRRYRDWKARYGEVVRLKIYNIGTQVGGIKPTCKFAFLHRSSLRLRSPSRRTTSAYVWLCLVRVHRSDALVCYMSHACLSVTYSNEAATSSFCTAESELKSKQSLGEVVISKMAGSGEAKTVPMWFPRETKGRFTVQKCGV